MTTSVRALAKYKDDVDVDGFPGRDDFKAMAASVSEYYLYRSLIEQEGDRGFGLIIAGLGALLSVASGVASLAQGSSTTQVEAEENPYKDILISINNCTRMEFVIGEFSNVDRATVRAPHIEPAASGSVEFFFKRGNNSTAPSPTLSLAIGDSWTNTEDVTLIFDIDQDCMQLQEVKLGTESDTRTLDSRDSAEVSGFEMTFENGLSFYIIASPVTNMTTLYNGELELTILEKNIPLPDFNTDERSETAAFPGPDHFGGPTRR